LEKEEKEVGIGNAVKSLKEIYFFMEGDELREHDP
jgi:hypothetical protein